MSDNIKKRLVAAQQIRGDTYVKALLGGSGSDLMNDARAVQEVLKLALQDKPNKSPQDIHVLYLGTATYDIRGFFIRQTQRFAEAGCTVNALKVAGVLEDDDDDPEDSRRLEDFEQTIEEDGGGTTTKEAAECAASTHQ